MKTFTVGQKVLCNGYEGNISEVCTGQLAGMYEVVLSRGGVCVDGEELIPLPSHPRIFGAQGSNAVFTVGGK